MQTAFISDLKLALGDQAIITDPEQCRVYGTDTSSYYYAMPDVVVLPQDQQQIVKLIHLCNKYHIPVTARGAGTGSTGAAVPIKGGVVLSLERMQQIIKCDPANRVIVTEPGVTNQQIQDAAKVSGYFWPPDPGSGAYATIGGNLACNAAGPHAVKYGTCRENTLGLTAVTGTGDVINTGAYTTKSSVGYDLTRLLIGSEGTLAIITKAILKLTPLPEATTTLQAFYTDIHATTKAVTAIMAQPVVPAALEYIDGKALKMIADYAKVSFPTTAQAMLLIQVDGSTNTIAEAHAKIAAAATQPGLIAIQEATSAEQEKTLWETRKVLSLALKTIAPRKINEDIVVPVAQMPQLITGIEKLGQEYQINIINFGHAGNGNIHVNLMIDPTNPIQQKNADICLEKIFDLVLQLNGSISGEHGVGIAKRAFIGKEIDAVTLNVMRKIKQQFDPNNILNPEKKLP